MQNTEWKCPIEKWQAIEPDTARFFFEEAGKSLASDNAAREFITGKAFNLMTLLVAVGVASAGFVVQKFFDGSLKPGDPFSLAVGIALALLSVSAILCARIFRPRAERFPGAEPAKLMLPEFVQHSGKEQLVAALICQCENYQGMICKNAEDGSRDACHLKTALRLMALSPIAGIVTYCVALWVVAS